MAWWVCWNVSDSGGDVLDPERPYCFFFFLILSVLVLEVEGERRKGKERERNSKKIIKNNI